MRRLAAEIYETRYAYLLRIVRRNAPSEADAEEAVHDAFVSRLRPEARIAATRLLTLVLKRRCWRLRDNAHRDRSVVADADSDHQEATETIERASSQT